MIRVYIPKRIDSIKSEIIEASLRLRDAGMVEGAKRETNYAFACVPLLDIIYSISNIEMNINDADRGSSAHLI